MWIVERIAFFTLIRDKGRGLHHSGGLCGDARRRRLRRIFFGGGADLWLWASLAILMLALWLNNPGQPPYRGPPDFSVPEA